MKYYYVYVFDNWVKGRPFLGVKVTGRSFTLFIKLMGDYKVNGSVEGLMGKNFTYRQFHTNMSLLALVHHCKCYSGKLNI